MSCSLCCKPGHNSRTCVNHYKCRTCGKRGHNFRTCPRSAGKRKRCKHLACGWGGVCFRCGKTARKAGT